MFKRLLRFIFLFFAVIFILYLVLPEPNFPKPLPNSIQSTEPGDQEDTNRRAYYTDLTRGQVMDFYEPQFRKLSFFEIPVPTYRLNYPPEEAGILVRDQTHSVFLEEIVHPFRESFFINGYEPQGKEAPFEVNGKVWLRKITVKYVQSSLAVRTSLSILSLVLLYIVIFEWVKMLGILMKTMFGK